MKLGLYMRNMGDTSTREIVRDCALGAEAAGIDDLWFADHIAIPPDDAEGSNGRYLDPLATIAWLAGATERIHLGTGVLILPYRPALPTAKWIATIQELSGGRMLLGVGIGWMDAEFRAVGIPRSLRGAQSDETLEFFEKCFAEDEVVSNGQPMLFRPRPPKPPLFVGGGAPYATKRAARFGGGWMPMGADPVRLKPAIAHLHILAEEAERPRPEVICLGSLDPSDPGRSAAHLNNLAELGVTRFVLGGRYASGDEFQALVDLLVAARDAAD